MRRSIPPPGCRAARRGAVGHRGWSSNRRRPRSGALPAANRAGRQGRRLGADAAGAASRPDARHGEGDEGRLRHGPRFRRWAQHHRRRQARRPRRRRRVQPGDGGALEPAGPRGGVADKATFVQGDMYEADISKATVMAVFLLPANMEKLLPTVQDAGPGQPHRVNTFGFERVGSRRARHREGRACADWCEALLWIVPAQAAGTWSLDEGPGSGSLKLTQLHQVLYGTLSDTGGDRPIAKARMRGYDVSFTVGDRVYTGRVQRQVIEGTVTGPDGSRRLEGPEDQADRQSRDLVIEFAHQREDRQARAARDVGSVPRASKRSPDPGTRSTTVLRDADFLRVRGLGQGGRGVEHRPARGRPDPLPRCGRRRAASVRRSAPLHDRPAHCTARPGPSKMARHRRSALDRQSACPRHATTSRSNNRVQTGGVAAGLLGADHENRGKRRRRLARAGSAVGEESLDLHQHRLLIADERQVIVAGLLDEVAPGMRDAR